MRAPTLSWLVLAALFLLLAGIVVLAIDPGLDLAVAAHFFDPAYQPSNPANHGFYWREAYAANVMHEAIQWGARLFALLLVVAMVMNRHRKAAAFLLVALLIGPGLVTNTVLKDNWGRARPVQVQEFGGTAAFTPALQPASQCEKNCSFVSGDGALGFFLHALFYVVPAAMRRRAFAAGFIGGGVLFGGLRVMMGAHFLSDVLWSGLVVLLVTAAIHALFYGARHTVDAWKALLPR